MTELVVAHARVEDFLEVAALDRTGWQHNPDAGFVPDGEHVWRIWVEYALVVVAREVGSGGGLAGFGAAFPTRDPRLWCLHKLLVRPERRSTGCGRALMEVITAFFDAEGVASFLTTDPRNAAMRNLSEAYGFRADELVQGYYRPEEDRLVFRRSVQPLA